MFVIGLLLIVLVSVSSYDTSNNKRIKPRLNFKRVTTNENDDGVQVSKSSKSNKGVSNNVPSVIITQDNMISRIAINVRDEVEDIYDAIVFADDNEERLEAVVDIAVRHKVLIGCAMVTPVLRNAIMKQILYSYNLGTV